MSTALHTGHQDPTLFIFPRNQCPCPGPCVGCRSWLFCWRGDCIQSARDPVAAPGWMWDAGAQMIHNPFACVCMLMHSLRCSGVHLCRLDFKTMTAISQNRTMYILTPWNAEIWLQLGFSFPAGLLPCPAKLKLPSRPAMRSWCTGIGNHHREFGQLLFEGIVFLNRPKMMQTSKFVSRMLCTISVSSSPCSTVWLLNPHTHFRT